MSIPVNTILYLDPWSDGLLFHVHRLMASVFMVLIWLASYKYPAHRPYIAGKRQLCVFPNVGWFHDRVQRAGMDSEGYSSHKINEPRPFNLRALCQVVPSKYEKGVLTAWSAEESLQLAFYHRPVDAYSVRTRARA